MSLVKEIFELLLLCFSGLFRRNQGKTIILLQENKIEGKHINSVIREFEASILNDPTTERRSNDFHALSVSSKMNYFLEKLINNHILNKQNYFVVLMGPDVRKLQPFQILASQLDVYMFDAWPPEYFPYIKKHIEKLKISHIFFSSRQVTEIFRDNQVPNCFWIPEGVDCNKYYFHDYGEKNIDILQFGRRYDFVHEELLKNLDTKTYKYMYTDGNLLFNSDPEFKEGLARSKISLCFPASITHPEKAGGISTMTTRYLQSMASKCLVVGVMPDEMKELFEYTPIVELNLEKPASHLNIILNDFSSYIPLIEKNYNYVRKNHTWFKRWENIKKYIEKA